jgi:four helix bundle protein
MEQRVTPHTGSCGLVPGSGFRVPGSDCHDFFWGKKTQHQEDYSTSKMSYKDFEIYQLSEKLAIEVHALSLGLPKFEMYEEGSQIRRSSKGVTTAIVEGYGRRRYVPDYVRFLIYALSECDETIQHLKFLLVTNSLTDIKHGERLKSDYDLLSRKLNNYIKWVDSGMQPRPKKKGGTPAEPGTRNPEPDGTSTTNGKLSSENDYDIDDYFL